MSENRRPSPAAAAQSRGSPSPFFDNVPLAPARVTRSGAKKAGAKMKTKAKKTNEEQRVLSERNVFLDVNGGSNARSRFGAGDEEDDEHGEDDNDNTNNDNEDNKEADTSNVDACFDFSAISDSTPPPPPTPFREYVGRAASPIPSVGPETGVAVTRTPTRKRVDFAALASAKKKKSIRKGGKGKGKKKDEGQSNLNGTDIDDGEAKDQSRDREDGNTDRDKEQDKDSLMLDLDVDMSMVVVAAERMQLISPPPEETLEGMRRRSSAQFTPAQAGKDKEKEKTPATTTVKRKRATRVLQPKRSQVASSSSLQADVPMEDVISFDDNLDVEGVEATPNPKPRKLGRRERDRSPTRSSVGSSSSSSQKDVDGDEGDDEDVMPMTPSKSKETRMLLVQSPHGRNPDADFIPALVLPALAPDTVARRAVLGARGSRRSATPIPPYEPPTDVFTPPREVFLSPAPGGTSSRRSVTPGAAGKGKGKGRGGRKMEGLRIVTVKQEIPDDIDLRAPMPPPSPTDDPLLLSGPPEEMTRMQSVEVEVQTEPEVQVDVLPPSSPGPLFDSEDTRTFEFGQGSSSMIEEDSMVDDPQDAGVSPVMLFEGAAAAVDCWSDSDDENVGEQIEEGEGEYTGHFRTVKVPTQEDPPSSATRARQEEWGRPISPYPYPRKIEEKQEEEREEEEVREMSLTLEDDDEESDSDMAFDPSLVKITSGDPRAAARAAAILKQHDYDCFTKIKRRHSTVDSLIKSSRRRNLVSSGITKSRKSASVIGERVFIPGSPSTTLPALLQEAEQEVSRVLPASPTWNPFLTPEQKPRPSSSMTIYRDNVSRDFVGDAEWTKEEWKLLDACFTDERLDLADQEDALAPVDIVQIENVVDRFVAFVGGQEIIDKRGEAWSRPNLIERTRALQKKQRSGKVAHPTTPIASPFFPRSATTPDYALGGAKRVPYMEVPDFTPLVRRPLRPVLPAPVTRDAPFSNLPLEEEESPRIPASLLAPRYSHLLEEAIAIGKEGEFKHPDTTMSETTSMLVTPSIARVLVPEAPPTLGKRVKGFLFSYLPTLSSRPEKQKSSSKPGLALPLPPPEILERPRGPVKTPARPAVPKARHPREMVRLHRASGIPKRVGGESSEGGQGQQPKRLVELNHCEPPPEEVIVRSSSGVRQRRSSGSSVKDLVRGFEEMEREEREKARVDAKARMRMGVRGMVLDTRPKWKP